MNPSLQGCGSEACSIMPGDSFCVVPYLRNVMCESEYRRYPVVDQNGNSPGYLSSFFSCNPKWANQLTIDKCCQVIPLPSPSFSLSLSLSLSHSFPSSSLDSLRFAQIK